MINFRPVGAPRTNPTGETTTVLDCCDLACRPYRPRLGGAGNGRRLETTSRPIRPLLHTAATGALTASQPDITDSGSRPYEEELINWLSLSVAFSTSSIGTITHATRYSTTPLPPSAAMRTITSRTMFASIPLYAAKPPHTPAILRSVVDRVSRRESRRSGWPADRSVRFMTSDSSWSYSLHGGDRGSLCSVVRPLASSHPAD